MALTVFLYQVSNIDLDGTAKVEQTIVSDEEVDTNAPTTQFVSYENLTLLSAKVIFRGISLWSNNVRILNRTANFVARGNQPKKFNFNMASGLVPDDKLRIEFHTANIKRRRKKMVAIYEVVLEGLIDTKSIDLRGENLSDLNNRLLAATVQLKLYYTPPDIEQQLAARGYGDTTELIDWKSMFDDEGRHGGHRYRHAYSKKGTRLERLRSKLVGRADDADSDSASDSDFEAEEPQNAIPGSDEANRQLKMSRNEMELLEKGLGRFTGSVFEKTDWQVLVHIIQGRDFPGLDLNPYVVIQIDDQKYRTGVQKSNNSPYFGEFFTFDFSLPATQFMEKVIFIKVHDAVKVISNFIDRDPIGVFRVDVSTVFNEREHAFERKWAQLINPKNIGAPCGHLLVSISVTQRGIPTKNLVSDTGHEDDEFAETKTLMPAAMPRRLFPVQMKVTLFSAAELPEMMTDFLSTVSKKILQADTWEPVDPYVEVQYNTMKGTTEDRNGTTPVWGEALYLFGRFPPLVRTIKVSVKDHSTLAKDRVISSFYVDLFQISESNPSIGFLPTFGPTWVFLYGSPREYSITQNHEGLNEGMGEAVSYKGRMLMAIECIPANADTVQAMDVQKESGIEFPEPHIFPVKRTFMLFGCIFDVSMIDKQFGNSVITFELSIGASGYLKPNELTAAMQSPVSSLTRPYPRVSIDNNADYFRLPIETQKPIVFQKHTFHDYIYRMALSNRLKHISENLYTRIREFESKINSKAISEVLADEYRVIQNYVRQLPCGCEEKAKGSNDTGSLPVIHPTLSELLNAHPGLIKMNELDLKRRKKLSHNVDAIKAWVSKEVDFTESRQYEIVKELNKIARNFRQMAVDVQPSLPDVFLWMISDNRRVAYARFQPEDLLFNLCAGETGLLNGCVQTIFLKTPHSTDKPINPSTNAKVQIFLWLGIEEYEPFIFKQLPRGFDMPSLPLRPTVKGLKYPGESHYEVRCHCYKARSLMAADETGLSDPFLSITVGNETQTTPVLKQSLCPQWNITLRFQNLKHFGPQETAEKIIGSVVVECYDYDDGSDGSELIGRFSTTAKLNILQQGDSLESLFQWYEFKLGDQRTGELLAVFELAEINLNTGEAEATFELEEIAMTASNFKPEDFVISTVKNKIFQIPLLLTPDMRTFEIEIMFWGLRECRRINLQPIEEADVTIECAGARITRKIKDVQKFPNFESTPTQADKFTLLVNMPNNDNFWPHLSILCIQYRLFGMKEIVGNLVVTNLQKYIQRSALPLTAEARGLMDAVNKLSKQGHFNASRIRRSVIDAYEAALAAQDDDLGKSKLQEFENKVLQDKDGNESEAPIVNDDALAQQKEQEEEEQNKTSDGARGGPAAVSSYTPHGSEPLSPLDRKKRDDMEKAATWWHKYYASKAKLKLIQRLAMNMDDEILDDPDVYAELFVDESELYESNRRNLWAKAKRMWAGVDKFQKKFRTLAIQRLEQLRNSDEPSGGVDESLAAMEIERLKELTLLQTFDIVETELESVLDYEGFNDCLDTFPIYKGKGSSRSDEIGDDSRVFAKFKGKFRIRELPKRPDIQSHSTDGITNMPRLSISPTLLIPELKTVLEAKSGASMPDNQVMFQFDLNKNPLTLKCRLYLIKALLYRGWDESGKADPFVKILLNNEVIIDDTKGKLQNTLEPVFGKSFEFDVQLPLQTLLSIQLWDWDMTSSNDLIAETKIDIENRWFSCHRPTCGLQRRYDSAGYNIWRDTKLPVTILADLCRSYNLPAPVFSGDFRTLSIGLERFECDPEVINFAARKKSHGDLTSHRIAHHEEPEEYIRQNTALAALHSWSERIDPNNALVTEHIECRPLFNPEFPETEQGKLEMWLDFFPVSRPPVNPPIDITPPKPSSYQLRMIVWDTSDVELSDENFLTGEKTSDIYVKAYILGEKVDAQQTDVHYRSLTGEGNFNYRFVYDFKYLDIEEKIVFEDKDSVFQVGSTMKKIPPRIVIRVYDADFFSADDFLGECVLNLTHIPMGTKTAKKCKADVLLNPKRKSTNLFANKRIAGWWPMISPPKEGEIRDKTLLGGKLKAEFTIFTAEEAEKNPAGKGREAPQQLPEPNRPKTSFLWFMSPWKTLRYVIWRELKWTLLITVIIFIFAICFLLAIWSLPGQIMGQITAKIFNG